MDVPKAVFGEHFQVYLSDGTFKYNAQDQILTFTHSKYQQSHSIVITADKKYDTTN